MRRKDAIHSLRHLEWFRRFWRGATDCFGRWRGRSRTGRASLRCDRTHIGRAGVVLVACTSAPYRPHRRDRSEACAQEGCRECGQDDRRCGIGLCRAGRRRLRLYVAAGRIFCMGRGLGPGNARSRERCTGHRRSARRLQQGCARCGIS